MRIDNYRQFIRPSIFLVVSILLFFYSDTLLWFGCLLLTLFYYAVDVRKVDESDSTSANLMEEFPSHEVGVLGHYMIDSDQLYGLFVSLNDNPVFVDIKEDKLIDERKHFATYLADNSRKLENSLNKFVNAHPDFSSRQIAYIGLHSTVLDQGEVFWEPNGYTSLKGLEFFA